MLLAAAISGPAVAQMHTYDIDPVHTRVVFAVDHAGYSRAIGTLSGSHGSLHFDPQDWTTARLEVELPLAGLDLGDERWNQASLGPGFLDAGRHPVANFVSNTVEPLDDGRALVHGSLTLRGVTRPLTLDVRLNSMRRYPLPPFRPTAGFSASGVLQRSEFGSTAWQSLVGDQVHLQIEAEATRIRGRDAPANQPTEDSAR